MGKTTRRSKQSSTAEPENSSSSSTRTTTAPPDVESQQQLQHHDQRIVDLEEENRTYQKEIEDLRKKLGNVSITPDSMQRLKSGYLQKLNALEEQVKELKKKQDVQSQLSTYRRKNEEGAKHLHDEIQKLKAQKVQLQCKLKLEAVQFRLCKAVLEKEILQLKKDGRKNEYEMKKVLALNQSQKMVLQRKNEEASMASKRLKHLLESRKALLCSKTGTKKGCNREIQDIERELEVTSHINQICAEYERQIEMMADEVRMAKEEAELLKQQNFCLLLQNKELDCREDPELRDLKEEVVRLSGLLSQLEMSKAKLAQVEELQGELSQPSVSLESSSDYADANASELEISEEISAEGKNMSRTCCSCSKKSLCKTMKCGCRASGGSCGTSCGCSSMKCTNREALPRLPKLTTDAAMSEENLNPSYIAEPEKSNIPISHEADIENEHLVPAETEEHCGLKKMPLYDIANTLIKSFAPKHNQRKKVRTKQPARKEIMEAL